MRPRKSPSWMTLVDERILEHLDEAGESIIHIMSNHPWIDATDKEIKNRCNLLESSGLIKMTGPTICRITTLGREYLAGEYGPGQTVDNNIPSNSVKDIVAKCAEDYEFDMVVIHRQNRVRDSC